MNKYQELLTRLLLRLDMPVAEFRPDADEATFFFADGRRIQLTLVELSAIQKAVITHMKDFCDKERDEGNSTHG